MEQYDARVDAYIEKSAAFAKPILQHLRKLVHEVSPLILETIKWDCPFYYHNGNVCYMVAFKAHSSFGLWEPYAINDPHGYIKKGEDKESRGNFGRITKLSDLPTDEILKDYIKQALSLNIKD